MGWSKMLGTAEMFHDNHHNHDISVISLLYPCYIPVVSLLYPYVGRIPVMLGFLRRSLRPRPKCSW